MKKTLLTIFAFTVSVLASSQDIHFSQFQETNALLNPSLAGVSGDLRVQLNYKDQWKSIDHSFQTSAFSFDTKIAGKNWEKMKHRSEIYTQSVKNISMGVNFFRDKAGDGALGTTQANVFLASHVKTGEQSRLSLGLSGGFAQQ